jgi:hypothetical protein
LTIDQGKLEDEFTVQPEKFPVWKSPLVTRDAAVAEAAHDVTKASARENVRRFSPMKASLVYFWMTRLLLSNRTANVGFLQT